MPPLARAPRVAVDQASRRPRPHDLLRTVTQHPHTSLPRSPSMRRPLGPRPRPTLLRHRKRPPPDTRLTPLAPCRTKQHAGAALAVCRGSPSRRRRPSSCTAPSVSRHSFHTHMSTVPRTPTHRVPPSAMPHSRMERCAPPPRHAPPSVAPPPRRNLSRYARSTAPNATAHPGQGLSFSFSLNCINSRKIMSYSYGLQKSLVKFI